MAETLLQIQVGELQRVLDEADEVRREFNWGDPKRETSKVLSESLEKLRYVARGYLDNEETLVRRYGEAAVQERTYELIHELREFCAELRFLMDRIPAFRKEVPDGA